LIEQGPINQPPELHLSGVCPMNTTAPHYLLFTEAKHVSEPSVGGRWRFVLEQIGTATRIEEADFESGLRGERLQLLAVVRGLEALEQKSRVTLITSSKYVGRGIRRGLTQWRQNDWRWERFGSLTLIKHHDLWQRIDVAIQIHQINCRIWQFDPPHVRTQVAHESDQAELTSVRLFSAAPNADVVQKAASKRRKPDEKMVPFSVDDRAHAVEATLGRGNHLTLNLDRSRQAIGNTMEQVNRVSDFLADKVKPIGQGKAFGYALS
jgi:ribonuclease HI